MYEISMSKPYETSLSNPALRPELLESLFLSKKLF